MQSIVILGSGLAGYGLLRELRKRGSTQPITVITADDGRAYAKPNLSNALAAGKSPEQLASQSAEQVAVAQNATLLTHTRVLAIDRAARQVVTERGRIDYDRLVLALGADPLPHGLSGDAAGKVLSVNDLADYTRFRSALAGKQQVAILGGGLIGCEFANDLILSGHRVSVIHAGPAPLDRLLPAGMAAALQASLAAQGVVWHCGRRAVAAGNCDAGVRLTLDDGSQFEAEVVLSAIGLRPRTALAAAAGLATNRGIVVNGWLQTNDDAIHAIGDCAEVDGQVLPFVMPLLQQIKALASTLTGQPTPVVYPVMPVNLKTPAHPLVMVTPAKGINGGWQVERVAGGMRAIYVDEREQLAGFALSGDQTSQRVELAQKVAPWLA